MHVYAFIHRKKGRLFIIVSVLGTLRFLPSSALSGAQRRLTTVS